MPVKVIVELPWSGSLTASGTWREFLAGGTVALDQVVMVSTPGCATLKPGPRLR